MHKEAKTNDQTCFTMMLSKAFDLFQIATYIATRTNSVYETYCLGKNKNIKPNS